MNEREAHKGTSTAPRRTGQAYLLFAASLILVVFLGSAVQLRFVIFGLGFTELVLILLPALLFVRWKKLPVADALRWKPVPSTTALLSIAVGITGWGVAAGMVILLVPLLGEPPTVEALIARTVPDLIWILFVGALLPGICEETLFRGAILGVLERKGKKKAVIITGLLFAVYHVNPWVLLSVLFLGIVFGILVVRTGSTVPAILAHIANNATAFTVTYFYIDQPESKAYILMGVLAAAWCVTFAVFWMATRGTETKLPALAKVPAGIERPVVWLLGMAGGAILALILAVVVGVFLLVGLHTVTDDSLEPDYRRGDQLVMFKGGMLELDLEVGDVVSIERKGKLVLRKIDKLNDHDVWLLENDKEIRVSRKEISGKVVHVISLE